MTRATAYASRILNGIFALVVAASSGSAVLAAASSPWIEGPKAKARLLAGGPGPGAAKRLAFVEIALEPGWKTYWRTPGDAGGLPPAFDWSKSSNLRHAEVLFPAPTRFVDRSGTTIGYQDGLVLPVEITPEKPGEPVSLVVGLQYGICKDVCIPVDAELVLNLATEDDAATPTEGVEALDRVPRAQNALRPSDPVFVAADVSLAGDAPRIGIAAKFPGGGDAAAAFLEAEDGLFLPVPDLKQKNDDGSVRFEAPLTADVDLAALKGKTVTVTLVDAAGASVATFAAE